MERELKNVTVETRKNGYSLKFDGMEQTGGYLYFSLEDLINGFLVHVGLGVNHTLNMEEIDEFMKAVLNYNDTDKCIAEINRQSKEIERMRKQLDVLAQKTLLERRRALKCADILKRAGDDEKEMSKAAGKIIADMRKLHEITKESLLHIKPESDDDDEESENEEN